MTDTRLVAPGQLAAEAKPGWRPLLDRAERAVLALRLTFSLAAFCLLVVALGMRFLLPDEQDIAELVAGGAAALVAIPVLVAAWESIIHPSLDGVTERLIALATTIAAWATGDLMTAAVLPIVLTVGHILEERSMLGSQEAVKALTPIDPRRMPAGSCPTAVARWCRPRSFGWATCWSAACRRARAGGRSSAAARQASISRR